MKQIWWFRGAAAAACVLGLGLAEKTAHAESHLAGSDYISRPLVLPKGVLRIDGGPMQTTTNGEMLHFGQILQGFAKMVSAEAKPEPKSATLTVRSDSLGTEALFAFADGSFWRRHFNARFTKTGADLILWVFDAHGTRARTWRGSALHFPAAPQDGRAPT